MFRAVKTKLLTVIAHRYICNDLLKYYLTLLKLLILGLGSVKLGTEFLQDNLIAFQAK